MGEDDWRSHHLICISSLNHLVFNPMPWSLIVLMFPFPKSKIEVYLLVCKSGYGCVELGADLEIQLSYRFSTSLPVPFF